MLVNVVASTVATFVMDGTHTHTESTRLLDTYGVVLHKLQMHLAGQPGTLRDSCRTRATYVLPAFAQAMRDS